MQPTNLVRAAKLLLNGNPAYGYIVVGSRVISRGDALIILRNEAHNLKFRPKKLAGQIDSLIQQERGTKAELDEIDKIIAEEVGRIRGSHRKHKRAP